MTEAQTFMCNLLEEKGPQTTRQLWSAARKKYGNEIVNVRLHSPVVLSYELIENDLIQLERVGRVQKRGTIAEWRLR